MFDLNEPASEPLAEQAAALPTGEDEEAGEGGRALSLLADSAAEECRGPLDGEGRRGAGVSSGDGSDDGGKLPDDGAEEEEEKQAAAGPATTARSSSWPRSERPSLNRSASLHMLFSDRPKSPPAASAAAADAATATATATAATAVDNGNVDYKDEKLHIGSEELVLNSNRAAETPILDKGETSSKPGKNLSFDCEFLQLKTTHDAAAAAVTTTATATTATTLEDWELVVYAYDAATSKQVAESGEADNHNEDEEVEVRASMCIDAFGQEENKSSTVPESEPLLEDSKFKAVFWQGQIKFNGLTVTNLVAGCTQDLLQVFKSRRVANELTVQRFAGTDKFLNAVKQYNAEPCVRLVSRSGSQSQNVNKLVQALAGGDLEGNRDFSLQAPTEGPSVAIIPLYDEANVWTAELYLVTGSTLSDAEPGELDVSDQDVLCGFLSFSADSNESFTGLKDVSRMETDTAVDFFNAGKLESNQQSLKKQQEPDKRARASSDVSADNKDLEEGQLVGDDQAMKESATSYEKRKQRYGEDDKKGGTKATGDSDSKTKDKHRHTNREHERDERDRPSRRDRDGDHRDRDFYPRTKPAVYDYIPRLDKSRYRDADKDRPGREHRDMHWDRGGSRERGREERSRSREREKDRGDKLFLSKDLGRAKSMKERGKLPLDIGEKSLRKRDRSPIDASKGSGKRLKDGNRDSFADERGLAVIEETRIHAADPNGELMKKKAYCSTVVGVAGAEVYCDLVVDACDLDTRSWIISRQHAQYLEEEYGVSLVKGKGADFNAEDPVHLKLSIMVSETCDVTEAKYFVHHAADVVKAVAQHGIYTKVLWYQGPVQTSPSEAAPAVHFVVMKLKGDDGRSLERIQEGTGATVEIVLDADGKRGGKHGAKASVVGLRLKCLRRKKLMEATEQVQKLLHQVSTYFAKQTEKQASDSNRKPKVLYSPGLPEYATARMVRAIFQNVLKEKLRKDTELPPGFESSSDAVVDVKYLAEKSCAFVEFMNDELLEAAFELYMGDKSIFCGLTVELLSPASLKTYLALKEAETSSAKQESEFDYGDGEQVRPNGSSASSRRNVKPLYLTELMRNASAESVQQLFEEIIAKHINPGLSNNTGLVLAVRHIPSRGCMFVDLATPELVDFMLDLYNRKPDVFGHMKMELGRNFLTPVAEAGDRKRSLERGRSARNLSPPPRTRRGGRDDDDYDEYSRHFPSKKQRSDPEKTVYADHLPENSTEMVIRKIFERVLFKHMTPEQRAAVGSEVVTEVRHVKTKFCAFVVFVSEDLARLALELYSKDEEVFEQMRLKPHFNSRLEDMYRDDGSHDVNRDETSSRGSGEELHHYDSFGGRRGMFKEVDRRRSVYVDRIPDKYDEAAIKEMLDRFLGRKGRGSPIVSHVSFFRDKYDPSKLCAFVEVKHEAAVQELLDFYAEEEDAFEGMRIRPAVKY